MIGERSMSLIKHVARVVGPDEAWRSHVRRVGAFKLRTSADATLRLAEQGVLELLGIAYRRRRCWNERRNEAGLWARNA